MSIRPVASLSFVMVLAFLKASAGAPPVGSGIGLPLLLDESFATGTGRWQPISPEGWKLIDTDAGKAFSQFKNVEVKTRHRSPWNITLLKDVTVGDFVLEVKLRETARQYPHRDACLVFGYRDPDHFYYVHFAATQNDNHANQVFIVDGSDRRKITDPDHEAAPVEWGDRDQWHQLKIVRQGDAIQAFFDDMEKPIMSAHGQTFQRGQIGIGTFDDTADFAEVKLWGRKTEPMSDSSR